MMQKRMKSTDLWANLEVQAMKSAGKFIFRIYFITKQFRYKSGAVRFYNSNECFTYSLDEVLADGTRVVYRQPFLKT